MSEQVEMADDVALRLRRRYPPPLVSRPVKTVVVAVCVVVAMVWLVWVAWEHAQPAVDGQVASYTVVSDTSMTVVITIQRRDPSVPATCRVFAQSTDFQPVADLDVAIEPGSDKVANKTVSLTTLRRATSVTVKSCTSS